jgi:hypothetical protein
MATEQTLFQRLAEMGISPAESIKIAKPAQQDFVDGRAALVSVERGPQCEKCGFAHSVTVYVIPIQHLPEWLKLLLTRSTAWRTKKT